MDIDDEKQVSRFFLAGILLFIALLGGVYYYFSSRDIVVPQTDVEVAIPLPEQAVSQGVINPDTAPPVNPRGMPSFAIPAEDPKPFAPLPIQEKPAASAAEPAKPAGDE